MFHKKTYVSHKFCWAKQNDTHSYSYSFLSTFCMGQLFLSFHIPYIHRCWNRKWRTLTLSHERPTLYEKRYSYVSKTANGDNEVGSNRCNVDSWCVCMYRVTFFHTEFKHAHTVITNPPIPIVVPPPPSCIHTTTTTTQSRHDFVSFDTTKFLVLINIKCCDFKSRTPTHSLFNTFQIVKEMAREKTLLFIYHISSIYRCM